MAQSSRQFIRSVLREVARRAVRRVRPQIPSDTLQRALGVSLDEAAARFEATLFIPHYWAVYVHDGRGSISKAGRPGFLIWFKDPTEDPRISGGFPERASQIRRLTRQQFRAGLARNRAHIAAGGDPFDVPMIVVKQVGPVKGSFFFTKGMLGFEISGLRPNRQAQTYHRAMAAIRSRSPIMNSKLKPMAIVNSAATAVGESATKRMLGNRG